MLTMSTQASEKLDQELSNGIEFSGYSDFPEYWDNLARYTQISEMRLILEKFCSIRSPTRNVRNFWSNEKRLRYMKMEFCHLKYEILSVMLKRHHADSLINDVRLTSLLICAVLGQIVSKIWLLAIIPT